VEHRIPVMRPEWIEETHARWINAEEVDLATVSTRLSPGVLADQQSTEGYKLLPFTGLVISVSGVADSMSVDQTRLQLLTATVDRRKQLIEAINTNGGIYAKDLDCNATHLVSATPTEVRQPSAKIKWAVGTLKVSEAARRAGRVVETEDIKIVYEDWVWDCVGYEGRWKEDWYDARKVRRTSRTSYGESPSASVR
jgi:DNA replication regulator DPB11